MDEEEVYEKITKNVNVIKIKQWITMEETKKLEN